RSKIPEAVGVRRMCHHQLGPGLQTSCGIRGLGNLGCGDVLETTRHERTEDRPSHTFTVVEDHLVGDQCGQGSPNFTTPKVTGCPLNCAPDLGSCEQIFQSLWTMITRPWPPMSLAVILVPEGSELTATFRLLPIRSGIAWPSATGEGGWAPRSAAGHLSSSLTTPKSSRLPLLTLVPAAGRWKQTFQSRSKI